MSETLYIAMPAYNEESNIEATIAQWYPVVEKVGPNSRLVIVDDGSKDKTFSIMEGLKNKYPQFLPISKANSGHGATCVYAYDFSIKNGADFIFQTDSDGQTESDEFWSFWEKRNEFDFIIGARNNRQDGFSRILVTKVLGLVVFLVFGQYVIDSNTPFRLMKASKLKPILALIPTDFFLSNVVISMFVVKRKERSLWLPITFKPRQGGVNSINLSRIFKIGYKAVGDFYQIKRNS